MSEVLSKKPLPQAIIAAEHLPSIPIVALEVLRLCRDDETTLDDLAAAISNDASLSARLLRFANSSLYNLGSEVGTLQRATLVLGMKTVQLMSLSFSLASSLPREDRSDGFDYRTFWRRSIVRAVAARRLAQEIDPSAEDECFLCGLLAELGKMVLARCLPEDFGKVLERSADGWSTPELEQELLGFRHSDVAEALLRAWGLPDVISGAVGCMHAPGELPSDSPPRLRSITNMLAIAEHATDVLTERGGGEALALAEVAAESTFCLDPDRLRELLASLEDAVRETSEMLNVRIPAGRTFEEIVVETRDEFLRKSVETLHELEDAQVTGDLSHRRHILRDARFVDPQTGIPNRAAFDYVLDREIGARLNGFTTRPLGIITLEVDRLASMEATFGQDVREEVLRLVSATLVGQVRRLDLAARLDDRLFAVIMGAAHPFGVRVLAERMRRAVEVQSIEPGGTPVRVTITLGGACLEEPAARTDGQALLEVARRYLRRARAKGTNRHLIHGTILRPGRSGDTDV